LVLVGACVLSAVGVRDISKIGLFGEYVLSRLFLRFFKLKLFLALELLKVGDKLV
jgi:hypothetical protein